MAVSLSPFAGAGWQFFDNNGVILSGGKLYVYAAGTTSSATTYTSSTGLTANTNPIILNSSGRLANEIWLTVGLNYKFILKTSADVLIGTWDNIPAGTTDVADLQAALASSTGAGMIGYIAGGTAVATTVQAKLRETVSVKDFGADPSATAAENNTAFTNAIAYAISSNKPLYIPAGTYLYSSIPAITTANTTIYGDGSSNTILKFTGTGIALDLGTSSGFRNAINISGFTVEGNSNTTAIIRATAITRSQWSDINVREADTTSGIGFVFRACMLNRFESLMCSQDRQTMLYPPLEAFNIEALAPYGNSSNNTFTNLYAEGLGHTSGSINIGVRISGGDQNTFIGGSPESCNTYGLLVAANCRFNTFVGVGFENLNATADVADAGISSRYINCYSSQKFLIQDRSCVVQGGYFERIQIDNTASRARVQDVTVNNWSTGSGGLVDNGVASFLSNIYDIAPKLSTVVITGTGGQFSCAATTLSVGMPVTISGTFGGTGSITGYSDPTTYYIINTNGTTTFTLSATLGGSAITTTAGTPTGLTYTLPGKFIYLQKSRTGITVKLSTVIITGTSGQFSCATTTLSVGMPVTISGTFGGTGSITGYSDPTTYYIINTNGTTTFTLSATLGGSAITTTAGTPTGLTYTLSVNSSIFTWTNTTGQFVSVVAQTGTITQVRIIRDTDSWLTAIAVPNSYLVGPNDSIEFSYSVAPLLSYVPYNGFQG